MSVSELAKKTVSTLREEGVGPFAGKDKKLCGSEPWRPRAKEQGQGVYGCFVYQWLR